LEFFAPGSEFAPERKDKVSLLMCFVHMLYFGWTVHMLFMCFVRCCQQNTVVSCHVLCTGVWSGILTSVISLILWKLSLAQTTSLFHLLLQTVGLGWVYSSSTVEC